LIPLAEIFGNDDGITFGLGFALLVAVVGIVRLVGNKERELQSVIDAGKAQILCNEKQQAHNVATDLRLDRLERPVVVVERDESSVRASRTGRFSTIEERE
jgi:hypothetical protein